MSKRLDKILKASKELREAQKNYMKDRGNDELGKIVGEKAKELDKVIKEIEESYDCRSN